MHRNAFAFLLAAVTAVGATASACADPCDALYDAGIKVLQTPNHAYITIIHSAEQMHNSDTFKQGTGKPLYSGKTESFEAIFDGKTSYLLHHGNWMRSPMQPKDQLEEARQKGKTYLATCTLVGSQSIDGQSTTLYRFREKAQNSDWEEWVSKSGGLPVHAKSTNPDGSGGEVRYEYTNVHTPAGVR